MGSRILTVSGLYQSPSSKGPVPAVRIQGKWIQELGIHIGDKVEIDTSEGEITIRLQKEGSRQ